MTYDRVGYSARVHRAVVVSTAARRRQPGAALPGELRKPTTGS
jgi:hypothetical protein